MGKRLLIALALACGLTGCGSGEDDPTIVGPSESAPPVTSPSGSGEPSATASGVPTDDVDQVLNLTVSGGKVTGSTGRVSVRLGSKVRITVTADVADEVHLHGYDLTVRTSPGTAVQLELTADRAGVYEVELEESKLLLTRLAVS